MGTLFSLICAFFRCLAVLQRPGGKRSIAAEMLILRAQLLVIQRNKKRVRCLNPWWRLLFALLLSGLSPRRLAGVAIIVKPSTLLNFHKWLVARKYSNLFGAKRKRLGRPSLTPETRKLIVEIKQNNPSFGCPQIAALVADRTGILVSEETVRRILMKSLPKHKGNGPSWLSFIGTQSDSLWSLDLFQVESIKLQTHWVLVVMDQFSRKIIGFSAIKGAVTGENLCSMFNKILTSVASPNHLSHDNDPLFRFHRWTGNLELLEIDEIWSVPYVPWSHPFVERLIGTVRRELLDQTFFWNVTDLERKLSKYQEYFNSARVHQGINGNSPGNRYLGAISAKALPQKLKWNSHCGGLFRVPMAA